MPYGDFKDLPRRTATVKKNLIFLKTQSIMDANKVLLHCF